MRFRSCSALAAIKQFAEFSPESPALIEPEGVTLSYRDLWEQIELLGRRLSEAQISPQETVAVLMPQGAPQVIAVAGVLNYCVCAPLQPRTTVAEVESALHKLSASALIVSPEFEAEVEAAIRMGLTVVSARNGTSPEGWQIRSSPSARQVIGENSETILLLLTSATTASSKQVPLTGVNLDAQTSPRRDALRLTASDRLLQMTSLCHGIGIENTFAQFLVGGAVIATGGFDPSAFLHWLDELRPTWYDCSPTVHQAALAQLKRAQIGKPTSLRLVQSAGAPLPNEARQELEQILRVPVLNDYGMTETGPIASDAFFAGDRVPNSAGRSCGLAIRIMGSSGELLPSDEEGEIVVRGPAVISGYVNDPEANSAAFQNGWFRTGDSGYVDKEGNLFITGRLKELINRGGEKISPYEVEAVLASHPDVVEAAAFSVPHPTLGEDIACAVVRRAAAPEKSSVDAIELRHFVATRLASFKVPRRIYFVEQIPRGELGKPQRWQLADSLVSGQDGPAESVEVTEREPQDDILSNLYEIWVRVLDRTDLSLDEDFFNAGGDSLAAINMLAEVDEHFGCQTSALAASFLDEPTLVHLTDLVHKTPLPKPSQSASSNMRVFPVREGASAQRLFCVPADEEEGLYFRRLATLLAGKTDLSIVRPANTLHSKALFTLERAGAEMAALVRQAQPEGPYFVGGFCYGGIVAAEAARHLVLQGQDVGLVLFDVPMPGFPSLLGCWRIWVENKRTLRKWRRVQSGSQPDIALNSGFNAQSSAWPATPSARLTRRLARLGELLELIARRVAWTVAIPLRRFFVPFEHGAAVQRFLCWAQHNQLPLYRARPIDAPILHFLCENEPRLFDSAARFGWRKMARRGIDERLVPLDHENVLHESNLQGIAEALNTWKSALELRVKEALLSHNKK
jgi:oxalate---CoA ligase